MTVNNLKEVMNENSFLLSVLKKCIDKTKYEILKNENNCLHNYLLEQNNAIRNLDVENKLLKKKLKKLRHPIKTIINKLILKK